MVSTPWLPVLLTVILVEETRKLDPHAPLQLSTRIQMPPPCPLTALTVCEAVLWKYNPNHGVVPVMLISFATMFDLFAAHTTAEPLLALFEPRETPLPSSVIFEPSVALVVPVPEFLRLMVPELIAFEQAVMAAQISDPVYLVTPSTLPV